MADYYNFQQVVQMCGIAESTLGARPRIHLKFC